MRLFRRAPGDAERATSFWTWWSDARDRIAAAIAADALDERLSNEITRAVNALHPSMAWEVGTGQQAQYQFCITPEGNPEIRAIAFRWLASAPEADDTWEFYASRQATPELMTLEITGARLDLNDVRAITSWDAVRRRVDVRLWHPRLPLVPEAARMQTAFIFLDGLIGEDEVERWVGQVEMLDAPTGRKDAGGVAGRDRTTQHGSRRGRDVGSW